MEKRERHNTTRVVGFALRRANELRKGKGGRRQSVTSGAFSDVARLPIRPPPPPQGQRLRAARCRAVRAPRTAPRVPTRNWKQSAETRATIRRRGEGERGTKTQTRGRGAMRMSPRRGRGRADLEARGREGCPCPLPLSPRLRPRRTPRPRGVRRDPAATASDASAAPPATAGRMLCLQRSPSAGRTPADPACSASRAGTRRRSARKESVGSRGRGQAGNRRR